MNPYTVIYYDGRLIKWCHIEALSANGASLEVALKKKGIALLQVVMIFDKHNKAAEGWEDPS